MMNKYLMGFLLLGTAFFSGGWLGATGMWPSSFLDSLIGFVNHQSMEAPGQMSSQGNTAEKKVLYWSAPMDPTFRSDKPGKSPMGMDLVPVYENEAVDGDDADVVISPAVVNNLGVRTAPVQRQDMERRIDAVGYVAFDESRISHIHLRTSGWIERLLVKSEGERVHKGQLLFELYSPDLVNAQEEYLQSLSIQNKRLRQASRLRLLALGLLESQVKQLEKSGKVQQLVSIFAPQQGIVSHLMVRQGMRVKPEMEIMTLADLSSVWLQTEVFERQASWVTLGGRAEANFSYMPGVTKKGVVDFIYPTLDPKTRTLKVRLRFDNPNENMKPNMYAKVSIFGKTNKQVLTIPNEAVIRSGHGERVMLALGKG
ncbi:MAG: efflux RND transporter periplasmic adaptor subunit, partial [SAR324 cluster bacterium]|nr:efflux RND transporter periplasmic adaptor subunit [SAR324 cluster bacterium]